MSKVNEYEKQLQELEQAFVRGVEAIAAEVREKHVVPLCATYRLEFVSGNGSFAFYGEVAGGGWYSLHNELDVKERGGKLRVKDFEKVFELLNISIPGTNFQLGHYMMDVRLK